MNDSTITVRYAKALYQVGEESKKLDKLKDDIENLSLIIAESNEFLQLLNSPIIKTSDKIKIFKELFAKNYDALIQNFFELLAKNRREQYLPDMCRNFLQMYKANKGIKEAVITTPKALEKGHNEQILKLLAKKFKLNIELTEKVNPDLIGGFKLRIDDQQIDASIATQLKKIQNELINA